MKPGDDGGIEPSACWSLLRRRKKQHPRRRAAAPKMPNGIPTPRPIFWVFVRPSLLADGDTGSAAALGVDEDVVLAAAEDAALDLEMDGDALEEAADDLIEVDALDPDGGVDTTALLGIEYDTEGLTREDCEMNVDRGHSHSLCVGVACASVVCGGGGIVAVSGPNCLIR